VLGAIWAAILFGLVLLGFGIDPAFPEWVAVTGAIIVLVLVPILILPKFARNPGWEMKHQYGLTCGTIIGSMAAGQIGFIGTTGPDLYFKVISNVLALFLLILLGFRQHNQTIIT
jgi:predicted permease